MARHQRIFLVGPMGAGKSSIGRRLAQSLRLDFVDADRALEERTGVDIPRIFDIEGESGFRRRETAMLAELGERGNIVVATGGGAVILAENRRLMAGRGTVVFLRATVDTQLARTRHSSRPLLQAPNPGARLQDLYEERTPLYEEIADIIVDTDHGTIDAVVAEIVRQIAEA